MAFFLAFIFRLHGPAGLVSRMLYPPRCQFVLYLGNDGPKLTWLFSTRLLSQTVSLLPWPLLYAG
jgi:hypothetical protein